ncbi:DedA family protein [Pseudonocardia nantongensis]|uniref:DedA family protein n=1 Tax=Pseudonocardia nantongensis TaxID=1181885 RepID=UPI00397DF585
MTHLAVLAERALDSPWLLLLLVVAVIVDGPLPVLPSEPVLFSAIGTASASGDELRIVALFGAVLLGSLLGDGLLYGSGRSSHRLVRGSGQDGAVAAFVRRHLHRRPIVALVATRLVPGGRLAAVTAAGRFRLPLRAFLPATILASVAWSGWMTGVGLLVGPVTGGDPLLSVLAGGVLALLVGVSAASARAVLRTVHRRRDRAAAALA